MLLELGDDGRLDTEWFHIDARRQRSSDGLVRGRVQAGLGGERGHDTLFGERAFIGCGRGVVIFLEREDDVPKIYSKDTGMRNMGR